MKRSWRDYLITLCLAAVIFTVAAFFLIEIAEGLMGDVIHKIGARETEEAEDLSGDDVPAGGSPQGSVTPDGKEDKTVTFLVLGLDHSKKNADAIFLVGMDGEKKEATVGLIPSHTNASGKKLGELYGTGGINAYLNFVSENVKINVDYYVIMNMSSLSNIIDFVGGISFNVPQNMSHFSSQHNFRIDLEAGEQILTGDQALQLVTFKGYANGEAGRRETQLKFCRAFCETFLVPDNLPRAKAIFYNLYYNVDTDFGEPDLNALGELIFDFKNYKAEFKTLPGSEKNELYRLSGNAASMYEKYQ